MKYRVSFYSGYLSDIVLLVDDAIDAQDALDQCADCGDLDSWLVEEGDECDFPVIAGNESRLYGLAYLKIEEA